MRCRQLTGWRSHTCTQLPAASILGCALATEASPTPAQPPLTSCWTCTTLSWSARLPPSRAPPDAGSKSAQPEAQERCPLRRQRCRWVADVTHLLSSGLWQQVGLRSTPDSSAYQPLVSSLLQQVVAFQRALLRRSAVAAGGCGVPAFRPLQGQLHGPVAPEDHAHDGQRRSEEQPQGPQSKPVCTGTPPEL